MMTDLMLGLWSLLLENGIDCVIAAAACICVACLIPVVKEYGGRAIRRIFHRRNWPHVFFAVLFTALLVASARIGMTQRVSLALQTGILLVYLLYILAVCRSIQGSTWLARRFEKKVRPLLETGHYPECCTLLTMCPWYLQDFDERLTFAMLKAKYLRGLGSLNEAYAVYEQIDTQRLYPDELTKLLTARIYTLMQLGNLPKAAVDVERLQETDPIAYGAMRSFLAEQTGDMDGAYRYAADAENRIPRGYRDHSQLYNLHQQMARVCRMRDNLTDAKAYYRKALAEQEYLRDPDASGPLYENYITLLHELDPGCAEEEQVVRKYAESVRNAGVNHIIGYCNFSLARAREREDREEVRRCIHSTYHTVHGMLMPPEQYLIEVSMLNVMNSEDIYAQEVLRDIQEHFDDYFHAPMPLRFKLLQGLPFPRICTEEERDRFMDWGRRLMEYAQLQAREDLDAYERSLTPDCVYERCWVNQQRIDFERRSRPDYDADYVLRLLRDNLQTLTDHGNDLAAAEEEAHLADLLFEMLAMGKLPEDASTHTRILRAIDEGTKKAERAPLLISVGVRVRLAVYAARLDAKEQVDRLIRPVTEQGLINEAVLLRDPSLRERWEQIRAYQGNTGGL